MSGPEDLYERFALRALRLTSGSLSFEEGQKGLSIKPATGARNLLYALKNLINYKRN
jgi:hypothetical protein